MPKTRIRVPMSDWAGGLNEDDQPAALQPNELRTARNVYWKGRALSSRPGASPLQVSAINSGAAGTGVWQLVRNQGTTFDNLAVFGSKLYKDAKNAAPTDITGAVTITAGQNNLVTFTHFNDIALMCNGVNNPWQWNGAGNATALGGSPPIFNTMLAKWNRVFGAGHAAAPRTIRFTPKGDPSTWNAADTVAAILGDSSSAVEGRDFIWQLGHLGDSAFVGLQNSIGRILYTGDSTTPFRYNQLSEFGIEGAHNYVAVGNGGYFLTNRGVHYVKPSDILITYETSLISGRRLRATWDSLNKARIKYTNGILYRTVAGNMLVLWPLTSGSGSTHDTVLIMDVSDGPGTERFAFWTGWDANGFGVVKNDSTSAEELLFCTTNGFVWHADDGTTSDNGAAFVAEAATRWEDFGVPSEKKNFRDLYLEARQTGNFNLNIDVYFDYSTTADATLTQVLAGSNQALWGTAVWGTDLWASLGFVREYLFGVGDGVVVSFRFHTDGANEPWTVFKAVPAVKSVGEAKESS
jgi:hypothetical protein